MKRSRFAALFLALTLLLTLTAQALTVEQAKELLQTYYIDEVPAAVLEAETLDEVIQALGDRYTRYLTAEEYQAFLDSMRDEETVGIGVEHYWMEGLGFLIARVFEGGAAEGKLLPYDVIVSINDTLLADLDLESALALLIGDEGTDVTIRAMRGEELLPRMVLTRATFVVPATEFELLNDHVGYIFCAAFGPETYGHFLDAVSENDDAVDCWIVDLRSNGGGSMQAAADALGLFIGERDAAYVRDHTGEYYRFGTWPDYVTMDPVIVLVDEWTASASELFAAGIQASEAGIVIGSRTYGKGVSQLPLDAESAPEYFPEGDCLIVTSYRNFSLGGSTPDVIGVVPELRISEDNLAAATMLLADSAPMFSTGYLRVHLGGWRWYVDLEWAVQEGMYEGFVELLQAMSASAELYLGQGGTRWNEITVQELAAQLAIAYESRGFADAMDSSWAAEINTLAGLGILRGNEKGEFMPEGTLTRAALCALLTQAIGYTAEPGDLFSDVPETAWYAVPVAAAQKQGLVQGYDGKFSPEDTINHEQFFVILARLAARLNMNVNSLLEDGMPQEDIDSGDYDAYSAWARELVWLADGIYFDAAVNVDPYAPTTREEAAASLYLLLYALGYL